MDDDASCSGEECKKGRVGALKQGGMGGWKDGRMGEKPLKYTQAVPARPVRLPRGPGVSRSSAVQPLQASCTVWISLRSVLSMEK